MQKYGAKGIDYEERVKKIAHSSIKVHKHLLSITGDNENHLYFIDKHALIIFYYYFTL